MDNQVMFKTTEDLRHAMNKLYQDLEKGKVTNSAARTRVYIAKAMIDTIKVEIAAANLGKDFTAVGFNNPKVIDASAGRQRRPSPSDSGLHREDRTGQRPAA